MTTIKKILVPVDFSPDSQHALDYAIGLAKDYGATIDLLHCFQVSPGGISPYGPVLTADYSRAFQEAAQARLSEWREKTAAEGVDVAEHLTPHFPSEAIVMQAEQLGSDLIVMGTRGLTGLKHVLLGSVAERTIRRAPCPVVSVKAPDDD